MSRRDRRNKRSESPARPESPPPGATGWTSTLIITALALAASAVFFYQITRPTSFLSAIMQVEYSRLLPPEKGKPRADGGPTWETVYQQYQERLRKEPVTQRHFAVSDLLDTVVKVERGRQLAAEALAKSETRLAVDRDNVVTRLAYAKLVDAAAANKSVTERFEQWRQIVDQPAPAKVSALYNKEFDDVFSDVLSGYIQRLDVRANLVKYMDHFLVTDHYAALPMIQARLSGLADELQAAGKATEAETCRRWVVRACLGLMEYEPDAGTRLLCADLAGRCLPEEDVIRARLTKLRTDYHVKVSESVPDLASFSRTFVPYPSYYQKVLRRFGGTISLAAAGIGAAIMLAMLLLVALIRRSRIRIEPQARLFSWLSLAGLIVLAALAANLGANEIGILYSESCFFARLLAVIGIGMVAPSVLSFLMCLDQRHSTVGLITIVVAMLSILTIVKVPSDLLAWFIRSLDLRGGALIYESVFIFVGLGMVVIQTGAAYSRLARQAALAWFVCMMLACAGMIHVGALEPSISFNHYRARIDEINGALGHDWRNKYSLPQSAATYNSPTIQTTP
jgi:hypothetical protein